MVVVVVGVVVEPDVGSVTIVGGGTVVDKHSFILQPTISSSVLPAPFKQRLVLDLIPVPHSLLHPVQADHVLQELQATVQKVIIIEISKHKYSI